MRHYHKLVRDYIPAIGHAKGEIHHIHTATEEEFIQKLKEKFHEEVQEYSESSDINELADLLECIHAACDYHGISFETLEARRLQKKHERGWFEKRIILESVE